LSESLILNLRLKKTKITHHHKDFVRKNVESISLEARAIEVWFIQADELVVSHYKLGAFGGSFEVGVVQRKSK